MTWQLFESVWPVLAFLGFTLVTTTLYVLASQRRHAIDIYDRVRASKAMRRQYLEALKNRQRTY